MQKHEIAQKIADHYGRTQLTRPEVFAFEDQFDRGLHFLCSNKVGWGVYDISEHLKPTGRKQRKSSSAVAAPAIISQRSERSDADILASQRRKFGTMERMTRGVIAGVVRSLIVSGPAGIGKTYTIQSMLEDAQEAGKINYNAVSGLLRPTGLYKLLWDSRSKGDVLLLDDADSIFKDETAFNLLKSALDTSRRRTLSWKSQTKFKDDAGDPIPDQFDYEGSIIFITNINLDEVSNSLQPHCEALISRSFYIDLHMQDKREYLLRIKDVLNNTDMAELIGLGHEASEMIYNFVETHFDSLREVSLRTVVKLGKIARFAEDAEDFMNVAKTTCFKGND